MFQPFAALAVVAIAAVIWIEGRRVAAILALVGAAVLAAVGGPAFAGETAKVSDTMVTFTSLSGSIVEYVGAVLGVAVTALIGWLANLLKNKLGLDIEAKHRDALHSALMTAVNYGLSKAGDKLSSASVDVKSAAIAEMLDYVMGAVPDAIAYFGLTPEWLETMLEAKLGLAGSETASASPETTAAAGS
nr:hypothetical protein [Breoghania sp.]